jgi:hypothetical protein
MDRFKEEWDVIRQLMQCPADNTGLPSKCQYLPKLDVALSFGVSGCYAAVGPTYLVN